MCACIITCPAIGPILTPGFCAPLQRILDPPEGLPDFQPFCVDRFKQAPEAAFGDDEGMTGCKRPNVSDSQHMLGFGKNFLW